MCDEKTLNFLVLVNLVEVIQAHYQKEGASSVWHEKAAEVDNCYLGNI
jgi:hypothetical protein